MKLTEKLYNVNENYFINERFNEDEENMYEVLKQLDKINVDSDCNIKITTMDIDPECQTGVNQFIDSLRIFLARPMDEEFRKYGITKSIKRKMSDVDEDEFDGEYTKEELLQVIDDFGPSRLFKRKGQAMNIPFDKYITEYDIYSDKLYEFLVESVKTTNGIFLIEHFLSKDNLPKFFEIYKELYKMYDKKLIDDDRRKRVIEELDKLDPDSEDYFDVGSKIISDYDGGRSFSIVEFKEDMCNFNVIFKKLMKLKLDNDKPLKIISTFAKNINTGFCMHQYYIKERKNRIDVYINVNNTTCKLLEEFLNDVIDINSNKYDEKLSEMSIQNANPLEEYLLLCRSSVIHGNYTVTGISNIYELCLRDYKLAMSLITVMYRCAMYSCSYNFEEYVSYIMNTALIEIEANPHEYEYIRYIHHGRGYELIASNVRNTIMAGGVQSYIIPVDIGNDSMELIATTKIPELNKTIISYKSNAYRIYIDLDQKKTKTKYFTGRSTKGFPYKVDKDSQLYKDFEKIYSEHPVMINGHNIYDKFNFELPDEYRMLMAEVSSMSESLFDGLYFNKSKYVVNLNDPMINLLYQFKNPKMFNAIIRNMMKDELSLYVDSETGILDFAEDEEYPSITEFEYKEYDEDEVKKEENKEQDIKPSSPKLESIQNEINQLQDELDRLSGLSGSSLSWDTQEVEDNLDKVDEELAKKKERKFDENDPIGILNDIFHQGEE